MINGMMSIKNPSCSLLLHNGTAPKLRVVIDLESNKDFYSVISLSYSSVLSELWFLNFLTIAGIDSINPVVA